MTAPIFGGQARTSRSLKRWRFGACDTKAPWPWAAAGGANGSRIDGSDLIVAASAPRINVGQGVVIESAAADLVSYPNDPSNGAWGKIDVVATGGAALAPNGAMDAVSIVLSGAANARLDQAFPVSAVAGVTYNYAVWLQGVGDVNIGINTTTGVGGAGEDNIVLSGTWQRHFVPVTYAPGVTGNVRIHAVIDRAGGPSASVLRMWRPQVTLGARPSSDVMTLTTPLTRTADSLTCTDLAALDLDGDEWTVIVTAQEPYADPTPGYPTIVRLEGGGGALVAIQKLPGGGVEGLIYDGSTPVYDTVGAGTPGAFRKYAIGFSRTAGLMRFAATGAAVAEAIAGNLTTLPSLHTATVGSISGGSRHINGVIKEVATAPRLLSAAEIIQEIES